jgi:hypothetical protein
VGRECGVFLYVCGAFISHGCYNTSRTYACECDINSLILAKLGAG